MASPSEIETKLIPPEVLSLANAFTEKTFLGNKMEALWLQFQGKHAEAIKRAIAQRGEFTTTVAKSSVKPQACQICFVSLGYQNMFTGRVAEDFAIDYVGVSQSGTLVATDEIRIKICKLIDADNTEIKNLISEMATRFKTRVPTGFGGHIRVPPKLTEAIFVALEKWSANFRSGISELRAQLAEFDRIEIDPIDETSAFERDAVALALETFGGASLRKEVLRSAQADPLGKSTFFSRLPRYEVREDTQINHDAIAFPGFRLAKQHVVGAIEVVSQMGQRLTIMNCNRQKLEETLGVDLIYFNHKFKSFVLVQYKRLVANSGDKPVYRPDSDKNYAVEIAKMNSATLELERRFSKSSALRDYRLGSDIFYFKFCEALQKSSLDTGMMSGMYLPLGLWNQFVVSEEAKGPRGGVRIDWDSHPRSFNNGSFCNLLRQGWIGSSAKQTEYLENIIEGVLSGQHMLILATTSPSQNRPDQLRDDFGRFTNEDDPLGTL